MKFRFGLLTTIFGGMTFEEVVEFAAENGLECLEVACWPDAGAKRRYAGVSHIDAASLTEQKAQEITALCREKGVSISSLAYYPNMLDPDPEKREAYTAHLHTLIDASAMLGVNMVTTFIGRVSNETFAKNLETAREVWPPILRHAEEKGVRIAIENCPMWFTDDEWPGGQNIMTTPANWRKVFEALQSPNLGINYDPSHFVWQQIDYIRPLYEFKDRIFHVHFKDIKLYPDRLKDVGIMANPLEYMCPKIPGFGEINWGKFVSALTDTGFDGCGVIELEDRAFEDSLESAKQGVILSARYLRNYIV